MQNIPDELKNKIAQFQTMQQQLQLIAVQKQQLVVDKSEAEEATKELKTAKGDVYKSVGPILMKADKTSLSKEIKETITSADSRLTMLESQEQKIALKAQELQKDLQTGLKGLQAV
jgi:prefoldin beta subunit